MRVIDIVKPEPRTALEDWQRWRNNIAGKFLKLCYSNRQIEVRQQNEEDWRFVFHKGGWHMHNNKLCRDCIVMAVF